MGTQVMRREENDVIGHGRWRRAGNGEASDGERGKGTSHGGRRNGGNQPCERQRNEGKPTFVKPGNREREKKKRQGEAEKKTCHRGRECGKTGHGGRGMGEENRPWGRGDVESEVQSIDEGQTLMKNRP